MTDEPRHIRLAHGLVKSSYYKDTLLGLFADAERINDRGLLDTGENGAILTTAYHDVCDTIEEVMNAPEPKA
jgi:hypothetical protein